MIYNSLILSVVTFIYGLAGACYLFAWIFRKEAVAKAATWVAVSALVGNTVGIVLRWIESYQLGSEPATRLFPTCMSRLSFLPGPSPFFPGG